MNINLVGSVLDSPELFWTYPDLEPLYLAFRQYLEIRQRIDLLNARVEVLQDLLRLLKVRFSTNQRIIHIYKFGYRKQYIVDIQRV